MVAVTGAAVRPHEGLALVITTNIPYAFILWQIQ
jgi:hypothetical protein